MMTIFNLDISFYFELIIEERKGKSLKEFPICIPGDHFLLD